MVTLVSICQKSPIGDQYTTTDMRPQNYSKQFPIKPKRPKPEVGTLWYKERKVYGAIGLPFWRLNEIKKDLIMRGYERTGFKITY